MANREEILTEQVEIANNLLQRAKNIPDGKYRGGHIEYDKNITQPLLNDAESWESDTLEIMRALYGEDTRQVQDFQKCIRAKYLYRKFREDLISELDHCVIYLNSLIKVDNIKRISNTIENNELTKNTPLVFISHSSKDKDFVEELVSLLESMGFDKTNLFCSSIPDYWIGLNHNILDSIHKLFLEHELFVIFIQSPRYYESPISLNEMGAAWVLKTNYCSILTADMQKEAMKGVVGPDSIFIKVDDPEASARMNELRKTLTEIFMLKPLSDSTWERKRNLFLRAVNSME